MIEKLNLQLFAGEELAPELYTHLELEDSKIQVDSALRDGDGYLISGVYAKKSEIPEGVVIDTALSTVSNNPVRNSVITTKINTMDNTIADKANSADLASVATSGSYNDLTNTPTIPTISLNNTSTTSPSFYAPTTGGSSGYLLKSNGSNTAPTWASASALGIALTSDLSAVATSGSYNDLSDTPTIPTVNDATLTIQKNGTTVDTFTANSSTDKTINITVPTNNNELTNGAGYTTNEGTITGITMNGSSKGTSGVVDLGTVITDVSDKQDLITSDNKLSNSLVSGLGTASTKDTGTSQGTIPILGIDGKLPSSVIPASAITNTFVVASESAMLELSSANIGDVAVRTDVNKSFILKEEPYSTLANWQELLTPTDSVTSVNGQTGAVQISIPSSASDVNALPDTTKYGNSLSVSGTSVSLKDQDGTTLSTITTQDTTYESKNAISGGTAVSLVTTGEKYTWNNKSDFSGSYTDLTDKPTIPTNNNQLTNGAGYITSSDLPTNYVTTNTTQTISGTKTFSAATTTVNSKLAFSDTSNPHIQMTSGNNTYYFQAYDGKFGLGPSWVLATQWNSSGVADFKARPTVNGANIALTSDIPSVWFGTQAQYDAISSKDSNTYYFIQEE